jgi:hypothetical protein
VDLLVRLDYIFFSPALDLANRPCIPLAACFASACNAVALKRNITLPEDLVVESTVALCGDMKASNIVSSCVGRPVH